LRDSRDKNSLIAPITEQDLFNLGVNESICFFQDKELSLINPRNVILGLFVICFLHTQPVYRTCGYFFVKNCKKYVLSLFKDSRLLWNQLFISSSILLEFSLNFKESAFETIMLVSSANKIGLETSWRSLISEP
jgi:hypothetical protein